MQYSDSHNTDKNKTSRPSNEYACLPHYKTFLNSSTNKNRLPISPATIMATADILKLQFSTTAIK